MVFTLFYRERGMVQAFLVYTIIKQLFNEGTTFDVIASKLELYLVPISRVRGRDLERDMRSFQWTRLEAISN